MIAEPGEPIATVALTDRINPANAPRPSNDSERLLFRQLYESLVRVDCEGRVKPALASEWRGSVDGRSWIVTLRSGAQFANGIPVTASDVIAGWSRDGTGGELQPHVNRLVQSLISIDSQTIAITLRLPRTDAPLVLAHTDLAIARAVPGSAWPLGTRAARIAGDRETLVVTATANNAASVRFIVAPGDPRNLLDKGVDLLVTRDPTALSYAATLPQFQSIPLAWHRIEVLFAPGRRRTSAALPEDARQTLASDAVRGEARGAASPFWWQTLTDCEVAPRQPRDPSAPASGRIVYDAADGAARDLAERLVGLSSASGSSANPILKALAPDRGRTFQRATGLTGEALALATRNGTDAGYILSLDRRPLDPCHELQLIAEGARWLDPETVVPLVDTRLRAIVRRGRSGVEMDWDEGLLITGVNDPR